MRHNYLYFIFLLLLSCGFIKPKAQTVKVKLSFIDSVKLNEASIPLQVQIKNLSKKELATPALLYWGIKNDPIADLIFEIKKKNVNGEFVEFVTNDNYLPMYEKVTFIKLGKNEARMDTTNIAFFHSYRFPQGSYRIRILYRASKYNDIKDVYSKWVGFSI